MDLKKTMKRFLINRFLFFWGVFQRELFLNHLLHRRQNRAHFGARIDREKNLFQRLSQSTADRQARFE